MEINEIKKAMKEVIRICKTEKLCRNCPFYLDYGCNFRARPDFWSIEEEQTKTEKHEAYELVLSFMDIQDGNLSNPIARTPEWIALRKLINDCIEAEKEEEK